MKSCGKIKVEEVRKVRDLHAAKFNYNLRAIYQALKSEENEGQYKFVSLPPRKIKRINEVQTA